MENATIRGSKYRLKGVTYHSGSPRAGRYTASVAYDEHWWKCNDSVVKRIEDGKVVSGSAYIPFYKQLAGRCFGEKELSINWSILAKCA